VVVIVVGVIVGMWVRDRRSPSRPAWIPLEDMPHPRAYSPRVQARPATAAVAPAANSVASATTPPVAATPPGPTSLVATSPRSALGGSTPPASAPAAATALGAAAPTDDNGGAPQAPNPDRVQRAQEREMAARRDARLRREATERARQATAAAEDGQEDEGEDSFPFEVVDVVSRSDDSGFDEIRRGPGVNSAYETARVLRYQQRLAEGYTPQRAMSVSEASTEDTDLLSPIPARPRPSLNDGRNSSLGSSGPVAMPAPVRQFPQLTSVQLAPARVPDRWVSRPVGTVHAESGTRTPHTSSHNAGDGHGGETFTGPAANEMLPARPETARLRQATVPASTIRPIDPRDSWRLSQLDLASTESNDTATRASTVISDDPWQSEVERNRRRAT
jgi:hypothetical protein